MSGRHTPGPWWVSYSVDKYPHAVVATDPLGRPGGEIEVAATFGEVLDRESSEMEVANAWLIAAAPDLLDVCRKLAELDLNGTDDSLVRFIVAAHQRNAAAAVAKATGKEVPQ